eukprot:CAMPEP_0172315058 /NCGR_PEP_ID=MMETSP1058-20130122/23992_1 /TAXON_ID=83371 /ORGANISM="Detonula confervacea, Strain CCMP 353" /LENGTH=566 /DNA_ID=CAMNT_0013029051 /DNA_START=151 /DNA_END=1854 /DNA_ORIENTATION=-
MSSSFKRRGKKPASVRPASAAAQPPSSSSSSLAASEELTGMSTVAPSSSSKSTLSPQRVISLSSSLLPGTKPWTNNLTLTSFGLREIDSFFFSSGGGSDGGGGQPLQTLVMLEEDRLADDLARALCRYWCAEGVSQRQIVLLGSLLPGVETSLQLLDDDDGCIGGHDNFEGSSPEELADFVSSLPRNLHLEKFRANAKKKQSSAASTIENGDGNVSNANNREVISAIIEEEEEENDDNEDDDSNNEAQSKDEGLINAWQYRKSIQDARSGIGNHGSSEGTSQSSSGTAVGDGIYCHSYDLSKRMWNQYASDNQNADENPLVTNTNIIDCSQALSSSKTLNNDGDMAMKYQRQGMALFCCLWKHLQSTLSTHPNTVIRLFLHRLPVGQGSIAMPLLMSKIRKENLPVVVLATIRPWKWLSSMSSSSSSNNNNKLDTLASLRNATDTILSLDSFSSLRTPPPPEFSLLQGILTVRKCSSFTVSHYTDTVTWKRPLAERFGVKRDGRKVTVQLLHLPPEEYSKGGSSTGGVRSGGGNTADKKEHHHGNGSSRSAGGCSSVGGGGGSLDF